MKAIRFHKAVAKSLESLQWDSKKGLADSPALLGEGESLGMPLSRPMPSVPRGAHEIRLKERTGAYRVFYFTKVKNAILGFHFFKKKSQATPKKEIEIAKKRLLEML